MLGCSKVSDSQFHRFRYGYQDDYFRVNFDHFCSKHLFLKAAGAIANIGSSLKMNHNKQIWLALLGGLKKRGCFGAASLKRGEKSSKFSIAIFCSTFFFNYLYKNL
jgi:hypothetical protein